MLQVREPPRESAPGEGATEGESAPGGPGEGATEGESDDPLDTDK